MDAGYAYEPIYQQVHRMGQQSIVAYNRRIEPEPIGFDKHFSKPVSENILMVMIAMIQNTKH